MKLFQIDQALYFDNKKAKNLWSKIILDLGQIGITIMYEKNMVFWWK